MVQVTGYRKVETDEGDSYIRLILSGSLSLTKSASTGNYYATVRRCSISSTFDEQTAKGLVGSSLPGTIQKEECEPYQYVIPDTDEEITLTHRWVYSEQSDEEVAINEMVQEANEELLEAA